MELLNHEQHEKPNIGESRSNVKTRWLGSGVEDVKVSPEWLCGIASSAPRQTWLLLITAVRAGEKNELILPVCEEGNLGSSWV